MDEDNAVDEPRNATADERPNPVDPDVGVVSAGDGGPEGASRVHWSAGEWAGGKDVCADDEADGDGGDRAERSLLRVGGGGEDGVDQTEGDNDFKHNSFNGANSGGDAVGWNGLKHHQIISYNFIMEWEVITAHVICIKRFAFEWILLSFCHARRKFSKRSPKKINK